MDDRKLEEYLIYKRERFMNKEVVPNCCSYGPISLENPFKWQGVIFGPPSSPYEEGVFFLSIDLPCDYPHRPPIIQFQTKIFHPNINEEGKIYIDILEEDEWKPVQTIETLLLSISSLLSDPNPVDPFNPSCLLYRRDWDSYIKIAKEWTRKYAM